MKLSISIISIFSFISLAVFGFLGMNSAMSHGHAACVASVAQNFNCPAETNQIGFVSFHLDALKSFSKAVFGEHFLFLIAAFLIIALGFIFKFRFPPELFIKPQRVIFAEQPNFQIKREFLRWLSLHEMSPNSIFLRH